MSACEGFSADNYFDKSARDSVDSKGLYGRLRFSLMGFSLCTDVPLPQKKSGEETSSLLPIFSEEGGTSLHMLDGLLMSYFLQD